MAKLEYDKMHSRELRQLELLIERYGIVSVLGNLASIQEKRAERDPREAGIYSRLIDAQIDIQTRALWSI